MTKKQWYGLGGVLVGLVALVFLIVFFLNKSDVKRDVAEEAGEEEKVEEKKMKSDVSNKLNLDYEMLTYTEMENFIQKLESETETGEDLLELDIEEAITDEFGVLNGLAYSRGMVLDGTEDELTVNNVINGLLFSYYFTGAATLEDDKKIGIARTQNLYDYENSLLDEGELGGKSRIEVVGEYDELISDTEGFVEGDTFKIGYPRASYMPSMYEDSSEGKNKGLYGIEFDVYIEEDINKGKFLDEISKVDVEINGYKAYPYGQYELDSIKEKHLNAVEANQPGAIDKEFLDVFYEIGTEENFARVLTVDSAELYKEEVEMIVPDLDDNSWKLADVKKEHKEYLKYLSDTKKNKTLLQGGFVTVVFEIDKEAIVGDFDIAENNTTEYFDEGHEPPTVTIDGVDIKLSVNKDGSAVIYYQR